MPEPTRPFIHYLTNADKLAANLEWYAEGVDSKEWRQVGERFSRYGDSSSEPLPEALKGTILRNVRDAKKGLKRAIAASESAA